MPLQNHDVVITLSLTGLLHSSSLKIIITKKKRQYKRTVMLGTVFLLILIRERSSAIAAKTATITVIQFITMKI